VLSEGDISVSIGSEDCHVTSMSATQLTCKPAFDSVEDVNHAARGSRPVVTVQVGCMQCTSGTLISLSSPLCVVSLY